MYTKNYTEWTREEKEEFAERRMLEMKLKNEQMLRRYAEVERDRITAESQNSAVTSAAKVVKKEKNINTCEVSKTESKAEHGREWDRGKPDKDHWKSPERHGSSFKNYRTSGRYERKDTDKKDNWSGYSRNEGTDHSRHNRMSKGHFERRDDDDDDALWGNYSRNANADQSWHDHTSEGHRDRKNMDKKDTWSGYSRNESTDHYRQDRSSEGTQNRKVKGNYRYKSHDNDQHSTSRLHMSPKRTRGIGYRNNESHRKSQHSYSDEKYKKSDYNRSNSRKKYSYRAHSRSSSRSESDYMDNNMSSIQLSTIRASSLWQNDKISEEKSREDRVEKWVKSVNKTNMWGEKQISSDQKEKNTSKSYSKFDRFEKSPDKSSDDYDECCANINTSGGNKSRENSQYISQKRDYNESKRPSRGASHNIGSNSAKQNDGHKNVFKTTKRSPQYSSAGSSRNENFRKQRRYDNKGYKNDDDKTKFKSKMHDNTLSVNDKWNISEQENSAGNEKIRSRSKSSKYDNADTLNDGDDGIWGSAEQSDIKWKLSDEERDLKETKNQNLKCNVKKSVDTSNTWNNKISDNRKYDKFKNKLQRKDENENEEVLLDEDPDGIWEGIDQSNFCWKPEIETDSQEPENQNSESSNFKNEDASKCTVQKTKTEISDGWEDNDFSNNLNKCNLEEISEEKVGKCKTSGQKTSNEGADDAKVVECGSNSNIETTRLQKNSDVFSQKSHKKNPVGSDDGGWSTVSEEGEIRSDGEDTNESKKLDNKNNVQTK